MHETQNFEKCARPEGPPNCRNSKNPAEFGNHSGQPRSFASGARRHLWRQTAHESKILPGRLRAAVLLAGFATLMGAANASGGTPPAGDPEPARSAIQELSPNSRMRMARDALARGHAQVAIEHWQAVLNTGKPSPQQIEAVVRLTDIAFRTGKGHRAQLLLAQLLATDRSPSETHLLHLVAGWLAIGREEPLLAEAHFAALPEAEASGWLGIAQTLGAAWANLLGPRANSLPASHRPALSRLLRHDHPPGVRFVAGWTAFHLHNARGEPQRAILALRKMRRAVRHTSFEDDAELLVGLAQLQQGKRKRAAHTLRRLQRQHGAQQNSTQQIGNSPDNAPQLSLTDLRQSGAQLAARIASLYRARNPQTTSLTDFLTEIFDRAAAADTTEAIGLLNQSTRSLQEDNHA